MILCPISSMMVMAVEYEGGISLAGRTGTCVGMVSDAAPTRVAGVALVWMTDLIVLDARGVTVDGMFDGDELLTNNTPSSPNLLSIIGGADVDPAIGTCGLVG
uniref:Chemosensory protein n=1 Tax=Eogystia hippophaecolus TaxID=1206364 RepID=A0A1B3P5K8_EOGHI|nr:chemosensory protein [Eogystia hippophaecolus]